MIRRRFSLFQNERVAGSEKRPSWFRCSSLSSSIAKKETKSKVNKRNQINTRTNERLVLGMVLAERRSNWCDSSTSTSIQGHERSTNGAKGLSRSNRASRSSAKNERASRTTWTHKWGSKGLQMNDDSDDYEWRAPLFTLNTEADAYWYSYVPNELWTESNEGKPWLNIWSI